MKVGHAAIGQAEPTIQKVCQKGDVQGGSQEKRGTPFAPAAARKPPERLSTRRGGRGYRHHLPLQEMFLVGLAVFPKEGGSYTCTNGGLCRLEG